ncbi:hypothetical protein PI125_g24260 [Phytophthora idaei]|nr:hypothetical protein PI125_g24260 [Phytophthora idaei]
MRSRSLWIARNSMLIYEDARTWKSLPWAIVFVIYGWYSIHFIDEFGLRRYRPGTIPSDAADHHRQNPTDPRATPADIASADAALGPCSPTGPVDGHDDHDAAHPRHPPSDRARSYGRDGPEPLVDRGGNVRHFVEWILAHDDTLTVPPVSCTGRGARHRDDEVPRHRCYLVHWLGPMPDSWEPRVVLLADVPDCVVAYEAGLVPVTDATVDAAVRRA